MQVNKVPPAKQPISTRKLEANRRNALRSTGPKTLRGKRYSRGNALKHGLSAEAMFEDVVSVNENAKDYNDLRQRLQEQYEPVGAAEELEVERIARCWWKLQRASRYEDAEIRSATLDTAAAELSDARNLMPAEDKTLIRYMCDVHSTIKRGGEVPPELKERVFAHPLLRHVWPDLESKAGTLVNMLADHDTQTRARKNEKVEKKEESAQGLRNRRDVQRNLGSHGGRARLIALVTIMYAVGSLMRYHEDAVQYVLNLELQRQAIPTGEVLDKVLRYESAAERHLARAMDRLERLQRQRRGELVPPPLNVALRRTN